VLEVNRPNRAARRLKGKSDPLDAYQADKSVLEGRTNAIPKAKDGPVECLRILRSGRASAIKARTAAINQIKTPRFGPGQTPGEMPGAGHLRADYCPAADETFRPYG
jgi:hypothetical protein